MDRMLMKRRSCTFRYNGLLFEWNENKYKKRKTAPKSTSMSIFVKSPLEDRYEEMCDQDICTETVDQ
jgi:hypothetical protein